MSNVEKSLKLILQNGKHAKTVSDLIFTDEYVKVGEEKWLGPIWWYNLAEKKKEAQAKQSK